MNELIKINYDSERPTVLARELHEFLCVKTAYKDWFPRMCEYGFVENIDFCSFLSESTGGRPAIDHQLTIEMAKEICMLQRNDKGKQARQYFIELEKKWNTPELVFARALKLAEKKIDNLLLESKQKDQLIGELRPKADYLDRILKSKKLLTITQIGKDYGMSGTAFNKLLNKLGVQYKQNDQWLLYRKYHDKGYTSSKTIDITRTDGRADVVMQTQWTQKGRLFLYDLLKANDIYPMIEQ